MWREERYTFPGEHFRVEAALCEPKPVNGTIPIWVGALQPRILRLAGEVADGWLKNQGWGSLEEVSGLRARVDAAAAAVGRNPETIRCVINCAGFVGANAAAVEAYRAASAGSPFGNAGLVGTVAEIVETVRAYRAAGVDTFNVRFPADVVEEQLRRFGAEVIPAVRDL
jgi:alkanesulfonate monooxygenase SsuD/methylene tetrahydromethanopterin reductase-like flavin-dependent oxidoreductase (luciferase family)